MPRLPTVTELAARPVHETDHAGRRWRIVLDMWVDGDPVTQGSHKLGTEGYRRGGRPIVVPDNGENLDRWRGQVQRRAMQAITPRWRATPLVGEVRVVLDFVLRLPPPNPRRKNDPLTYKNDGEKLHRAVADALTEARVWEDDGLATSWAGSKRLAELGEHPGVRVRVCVPASLDAGDPAGSANGEGV